MIKIKKSFRNNFVDQWMLIPNFSIPDVPNILHRSPFVVDLTGLKLKLTFYFFCLQEKSYLYLPQKH